MSKVVDLKAAKEAAERRKYAGLVLAKYDDFQHAEKRDQKDRAAEVNRQARNKF